MLAAATGERLARYWQQGIKCQLTLPYLNESALVADYYKDIAPDQFDEGYRRGFDQFNKEFAFSSRMACVTATMYLKQDAEFIRQLYSSARPAITRKYGQ